MDKREMKKELKEFLARELFLNEELREKFLILQGLEPLSEAGQRRFDSVIIELREEWIK